VQSPGVLGQQWDSRFEARVSVPVLSIQEQASERFGTAGVDECMFGLGGAGENIVITQL